ncbi:hypothetical protein C8J57DRAFT_1221481 [Mycena rebaudengoi]|nr:hypothetical protein C8J57DRAFT_1221481 [Mycena rebaudengoi]
MRYGGARESGDVARGAAVSFRRDGVGIAVRAGADEQASRVWGEKNGAHSNGTRRRPDSFRCSAAVSFWCAVRAEALRAIESVAGLNIDCGAAGARKGTGTSTAAISRCSRERTWDDDVPRSSAIGTRRGRDASQGTQSSRVVACCAIFIAVVTWGVGPRALHTQMHAEGGGTYGRGEDRAQSLRWVAAQGVQARSACALAGDKAHPRKVGVAGRAASAVDLSCASRSWLVLCAGGACADAGGRPSEGERGWMQGCAHSYMFTLGGPGIRIEGSADVMMRGVEL